MCVVGSVSRYDNDPFPWHRGPRWPRASLINNVKSTTAWFPGNCLAILYLHLSGWCLSCKLICLRERKKNNKKMCLYSSPAKTSIHGTADWVYWLAPRESASLIKCTLRLMCLHMICSFVDLPDLFSYPLAERGLNAGQWDSYSHFVRFCIWSASLILDVFLLRRTLIVVKIEWSETLWLCELCPCMQWSFQWSYLLISTMTLSF